MEVEKNEEGTKAARVDVLQEPGQTCKEAAGEDVQANDDDKGKLNEKNQVEKDVNNRLNANHESGASSSDKEEKKADDTNDAVASSSHTNSTEQGDSSKTEETGPLFELKEYEKKALVEFGSKIEEAILLNKLYKEKKNNNKDQQKEEWSEKAKSSKEVSDETREEDKDKLTQEEEGKNVDKGKAKMEDETNEDKEVEIPKDITLWGVPLLPSRGDKDTNTVLLKFLRAREFKVNDAFEMLQNTLQWRMENNIDSILEEDFGTDFDSMAYLSGKDREGHPVCYNLYGAFANDDLYKKTLGSPENREKFLRWRVQLMEKEIQMLDFSPDGLSTLLQISDLKDTPGPSRKDLRVATKEVVGLLQDNYPEFVAHNIFINVPFWYYAFSALWFPFLTQRTKSKFVFVRAGRVTESLLKYIAAEEIPVKYGGLKRESDPEFSTKDGVNEIIIKAGAIETIEIPAPEGGSTVVWDVTVLGWEVNYKEEFVPSDESSYTVIVKKRRWMEWKEESIRNSFRTNEPGKIVLTIENGLFKKKRVLFRYKTKISSSSE